VRIGITGVEGFLGSHLRQELRDRGHTVVGIDLKGGEAGSDPHTIGGDLCMPDVAQGWVEHAKPHVVIHMAAQVGRLFGDRDLRHTVESNATMTTLIAKACGDHGVRMVYTSTSEVYGDNGEAVCDEYDGPFSTPHNMYGLTKHWGEQACALYAPRKLMIWRPSMPYGPGVPPGQGRAALPNIIWQVVTGQEIPIHRGSERSWCWVGDTVRAMAMTLETDWQSGTVYNIGRDDDPIKMAALATLACDMFGGSYDQIEEIDPPHAQTVVKRLSTERLRQLGWEPKVSLETGMSIVHKWVERFDKKGRVRA
jgi:nucleoside-diphosphate-sugar epimerase